MIFHHCRLLYCFVLLFVISSFGVITNTQHFCHKFHNTIHIYMKSISLLTFYIFLQSFFSISGALYFIVLYSNRRLLSLVLVCDLCIRMQVYHNRIHVYKKQLSLLTSIGFYQNCLPLQVIVFLLYFFLQYPLQHRRHIR